MTDDQFLAMLVDFPQQGALAVKEARTIWRLQLSNVTQPIADGAPIVTISQQNAVEKIVHDGSVKTYRVLMQLYRRFASKVKSEPKLVVEKAVGAIMADAEQIWKECVTNVRVELSKGHYTVGSEKVYWDAKMLLWSALRSRIVDDTIRIQARKSVVGEQAVAARGTRNISAPPISQRSRGSTSSRLFVRQNSKYMEIDAALREIGKSRPETQKEIFEHLDGRRINGRRLAYPSAKPFKAARGWMAGFMQDKAAARAWLSKRWTLLRLPPLLRGPK